MVKTTNPGIACVRLAAAAGSGWPFHRGVPRWLEPEPQRVGEHGQKKHPQLGLWIVMDSRIYCLLYPIVICFPDFNKKRIPS